MQTTPIIVRNGLTCLEAAQLVLTSGQTAESLVATGRIQFDPNYGWTIREVTARQFAILNKN